MLLGKFVLNQTGLGNFALAQILEETLHFSLVHKPNDDTIYQFLFSYARKILDLVQ